MYELMGMRMGMRAGVLAHICPCAQDVCLCGQLQECSRVNEGVPVWRVGRDVCGHLKGTQAHTCLYVSMLSTRVFYKTMCEYVRTCTILAALSAPYLQI